MALTQTQLKNHAVKFLKQHYGLNLEVPLVISARLSKTYGKVTFLNRTLKPTVITLSKNIVDNNNDDIVIDILNHELIHYALLVLGKPFRDGDAYFENELKKKGVISQSNVSSVKIVSTLQIYKCGSCSKEHKMSRRLQYNGRYHSCKCGGNLIDMGKMLV